MLYFDSLVRTPLLETEYMAAILIPVNDIKYLKTWLAINEESIYGLMYIYAFLGKVSTENFSQVLQYLDL